jgi:sec-independent protein translocase protein TatA
MMGSMSIWHWVIVLVVVVLLFGTKKLGNVGSDIGKAVKGFKDGVKGEDDKSSDAPVQSQPSQVADKSAIDVEAREKTRH